MHIVHWCYELYFLTTSIYLWNTVLKFLYCSQIKYYFEFPASCKLFFKVKIELLPFEYTMFHFSRFRNTSALLYLHITTTVFRCVSTVCKHLGYARANIVFFHYFFVFKNKLNNKEKSGSIYQYFNWTRCPLFCQQVCWLLFMTISLLLLFIWIQMMEFIN